MTLRILAALLLISALAHSGTEEAKAAYQRGMALEKQKKYGEAVKEYEAALDEDPKYAYAHKQLGNCHYYLGDKGAALGHYEAYLAAVPTDAAAKKFADALRAGGAAPKRVSGGSRAGGRGGKDNAVYTNPGALAMMLINAGYNRAFGEHNTLVVEGALWNMSVLTTSYNMTGLGLGWRFNSERLGGWFAGPKVNYWMVSGRQTAVAASGGSTAVAEAEISGSLLGYGAEGGYQWIWDNGFLLNLGAGFQMVTANVTAKATATSSSGSSSTGTVAGSISGTIPSAMLNLGYAF